MSEDCIESAELFSKLFQLKILNSKINHAELQSDSGLFLFINKPSIQCPVNPGSISFYISSLNVDRLDLEPLLLESYNEKENYASFLDKYQNRIWIFEKNKNVT